MGFVEDIAQSMNQKIDDTNKSTVWPGTVTTIGPLTVTLDGSGVAMPCKGADFVSLVPGRRCVVMLVGSDLVVISTFGGNTVSDITITNSIPGSVHTTSAVGTGANTSLSFVALSTPSSVTFTTNASGKTHAFLQARMVSNVATLLIVGFEVRLGLSVGSGTVVLAANTVGSVQCSGARTLMGIAVPIYGLTPNTDYNAQIMHFCTVSDVSNLTDNAQLTVETVW